MPSIEFREFDKFTKDIGSLLEKAPQKRRELHSKIADLLDQEVDSNISSSVNDSSGMVRNWQEKHVGSGGGYAAVRPVGGASGKKSPAAITGYLERGHPIRRPSGGSKKYYPRIKVPYVDGRHFYQKTRETIEGKVISLVENFAEELAKELM